MNVVIFSRKTSREERLIIMKHVMKAHSFKSTGIYEFMDVMHIHNEKNKIN